MFEGDLTAAQPPDPPAQSAPPPSALADWKAALRSQFEQWLESITEVPPAQPEELPDEPDLYSFYEQRPQQTSRPAKPIAAPPKPLANGPRPSPDSRISSRPSAIRRPSWLRRNPGERAAPALLHPARGVAGRSLRLEKAFQASPAKSSWWRGKDREWRQAWQTQGQALPILISHLDELLKKEGVTRITMAVRAFRSPRS